MTTPTLDILIDDEETKNALEDAGLADRTEDAAGEITGGPISAFPGDDPVVNTTQNEGFEDISAAVDSAETGETIVVDPGTYDGVEIDVEGLTLEAADGAEAEIVSQEPGEFEPPALKPAVLIDADDVTVDGIDLVEGMSPDNNQDVVVIGDGVSGTTLTNLAVESPDFTGTETSRGVIGVDGFDGAAGDLTIENVEADRTIGLPPLGVEDGSEVVIDDVDVTKSDAGEAISITGPNLEDADIDLTLVDVTPQDNDAETGDSTDLLLSGDEATINGVDDDAEALANAVFDANEDIDEVEIGEQVITR